MNYKLIALMFCMIFLVGTVSALEWDNAKYYNEDTKTITIRNGFILNTLGKYTLTDNTDQCLTNCYAEGIADLRSDNVLFSGIQFKNKEGEKKNKDYKIYIEVENKKNLEIPTYAEVCSTEINGTSCTLEQNGTRQEELITYDWKHYKGEILTEGIYKWRIEGKKDLKESVDWIVTIFGKDLNEWAWWDSDWDYYRRFNATEYYSIAHTNEPIIFTINASTIWNKIQNDGDDLRIINASDDTEIDRKITMNTTIGGNIEINFNWSAGADENSTQFDLYYGNAGAGAGTSMTPLWESVPLDSGITELVENHRSGGYDSDHDGVQDYTKLYDNNIQDPNSWYSQLKGSFIIMNFTQQYKVGFINYTWTQHDTAYIPRNDALATTTLGGAFNKAQSWEWVQNNTDNTNSAYASVFNYVKPQNAQMVLYQHEESWGDPNNWVIMGEFEAYASAPLSFNASGGEQINDQIPAITLNDPPVNYNSSTQNINYNATISDAIGLANVSLYIDGFLNQTNVSGINGTEYIFNVDMPEGIHNWSFSAWDTKPQQANSTVRNITVDLSNPIITNVLPENASETIITVPTYNISLNASITDNTALHSCWYGNGIINTTVTCGNNATINLTSGYHTYTWYTNDTVGNNVSSSTTFLLNYVQEDKSIDDPVIEGEQTNIYFNLTATEITSFNGTLYWNNTIYTASNTSNSTYGVLNTSLMLPLVSANDNVNITWVYNLNGIQYNSTTYNQTVLLLTSLNITSLSCSDKALRFDLQDEENLTAIYGDVEYNFEFGLSNDSLKTTYGSLTNVTTFYACINASISTNYTIGYGEIQYRDSSYVDRRYYLFEDQTISNNTLTNHTLRDLLSSEQTSFLMTFEDTSLNVYDDKYTALWRWYPDLDEYQIVEMGKTDEDGETVSHINTEDTDYRVGLYEKNGSLIKLGDPVRFICSSAPCTFTLRVGAGELDYSSFFDVETSLTYNDTTQLFTLIYNDPNQYTSAMRLLVTRETGSSTLTICDDTSSGFTGVMTCDTSAYTGVKKAVVYRSASPAIPISELLVTTLNQTFQSGFGLFISIFLWLAIVLSGLGNNPLWTVILTVVGLIPALLLGSINIAIFTSIAVLGAIIIHFIKRALT